MYHHTLLLQVNATPDLPAGLISDSGVLQSGAQVNNHFTINRLLIRSDVDHPAFRTLGV